MPQEKDNQAVQDAPAAEKPRRGRPPKSATTTTAATPKRRGRPPKSATADATAAPKKKRGRPPKSATAAATAAAPKKRGRPAGVTAAVALKNYKAEAKAQISALKEEIKLLKSELRAAAQKEAKLLKLFEKKTTAVARFAEKWDKEELKKVLSPVRKKRARK